ncbi:MAG: hypothetical protein IPI97_10135 [Nitrosomonas sp.]|nr:hypothetical protein [Nitrosomonas sp.]MBK7365321.1 hypothetical protein [Nitrosomonas sp.]
MEVQLKLRQAFESGLKAEFGSVVGEILGDNIGYFPRTGLEPAALTNMRDVDGIKIETAVTSRNVDGGTLLLIRSNTTASALLLDVVEIQRWASLGLEWCQKVQGGGWPGTEPEWRWILEHAEEYSNLVIELKKFLGHV